MKSLKHYFAFLFCCTLLIGCGGGPDSVADMRDTNMKKVHTIYTFYMNNNGFRGPESEEEFMKYLESNEGRFVVKRLDMDPDKVKDYFISERDGEPFVIRYGLKGIRDHAIVFEKTGVDGMRYVGFGEPEEVDAEEYEAYLAGKNERESGTGKDAGFEDQKNLEDAEQDTGE